MTGVSLIVAMGRDRVIGRDNALPWRLRADLMRFKRLTMGHTIVMGRKTYESIGRPLPGRDNVVLSRASGLRIDGCRVVPSLEEALRDGGERVFVIGGAQVYAAALPLADAIHVTQVECASEGDTWFPEVDWSAWSLTAYAVHAADDDNEYPMVFMDFQRPD